MFSAPAAFPSCRFTSCHTPPLMFSFFPFRRVFQIQASNVVKINECKHPNPLPSPHPSISRGSAPPPVTPAEQVTDGTISGEKHQRPVYLSTRLPADTSRAATLSQIKLLGSIIIVIIIIIIYHYCRYYYDFPLFSPFLNSSNSISRLSDTQVLGAAAAGGRGNEKVNSWAL